MTCIGVSPSGGNLGIEPSRPPPPQREKGPGGEGRARRRPLQPQAPLPPRPQPPASGGTLPFSLRRGRRDGGEGPRAPESRQNFRLRALLRAARTRPPHPLGTSVTGWQPWYHAKKEGVS